MNYERKRFWNQRLALQSPDSTQRIRALDAVQPLLGRSRAVVFDCEDGNQWVVKGDLVPRHIVADRIVGSLASLAGYPVPPLALVEVPEELVDHASSICRHFRRGSWHGSQWLGECDEDTRVRRAEVVENHGRFADIAVLFGCLLGSDLQFLIERTYPYRVWSHDHGAYLNIEERWGSSIFSLLNSYSRFLEPHILSHARCSSSALLDAASRLEQITDEQIATVVGSVPSHWGLADDEKPYLCEYISTSKGKAVEVVEARGAA